MEAANCPDEDFTVNRQFQSKEVVSGANAFSDSDGSDDRSPKRVLNEETDVHEISADDVKGCSGDDTGHSDPAEPSNRETGDDTRDINNIRRGPDTAEGPELLGSDTAIPDNTGEQTTEHEIAQARDFRTPMTRIPLSISHRTTQPHNVKWTPPFLQRSCFRCECLF